MRIEEFTWALGFLAGQEWLSAEFPSVVAVVDQLVPSEGSGNRSWPELSQINPSTPQL